MISPVKRHDQNGVAVLTLDRPEKLNALDYDLIDHLMLSLDRIEDDASVQCVILTGSGEKAFSAGADIACFSQSVDTDVDRALREFVRRGQNFTKRLEAFPKPIIAAVNGLAFGGGCEVVEAVSLAVASDRATFSKPEIKLGFPPPFGGTQRLPRLIGRKRALKMLLTADVIDAAEAKAIGLINEVVPHEELMQSAFNLAERIMRHSPLAVTASLHAVTRGLNLTIDEGLSVEATQFGRMVPTTDFKEGISAFLEKRAPTFVGV